MQLRHQSGHVGHVLGQLIRLRLGQPIAQASPHHIRANHPQGMVGLRHQGLGQHIKITPLARQAVDTDHHMRGLRVPPDGVSHAVYTLGVGAIDISDDGL